LIFLHTEQLSGEIVWADDEGVYQALESALGQKRLSATIPATSAPGKKQKFPIFIQKSIHRMFVIGGKAEVFRKPGEVRKVPN
jgi:hypothetical protein